MKEYTIMNTQNFIKIDSDIFFNRSIPPICREIHSLALDLSKIPGWIIRKQHIANQLKISLRTVDRYFNLLAKLGLAFYDAIKDRWHVFKSPKPIKDTPCSEGGLPLLVGGGLPVLAPINKKDNYPEEKTTTPEPIKPPDPVSPVVVFSEENKVDLVYPEDLTPKQKADIKHHIKKAPIDYRQVILEALRSGLQKNTIWNPIGWVRAMAEEAAITGTFIHKQSAGDTKIVNKGIEQTEKIKEYRAKGNKSAPEIGKIWFPNIRKGLWRS
jgi:hypothetical protein